MTRSSRSLLIAAVLGVLAAVHASPAAALTQTLFSSSSTLNVTVQTKAGAPIQGATVIALFFNNGNPDPFASRLAVTNASGIANFSGTNALFDGAQYAVVAATQGYFPAIVDQFNQGAPAVFTTPSVSTPSLVIALSSSGAAGYGEIDAAITNATPNSIVFGQVGLVTGGGAAAFAIAQTNGAGAANLQVFNVAFASAGTYQIAGFDPIKNRAAATTVNTNLNAGGPLITGVPLDFATAAAPTAQVSKTQQSGSAGNLSVDGIITSTGAAPSPIPFAGLNFSAVFTDQFGQQHNDFRGAQADQNGRFQLYGLTPGVTYYTSVFGICTQGGTCYQGIQSTALANGFGSAPGASDFFYPSSTTVLNPAIQMQAITPSTASIAVYLKDQFGNPFGQAGVSLYPDGAPWQTTGGGSCTGGPYFSNPGFANINTYSSTGYTLITGLPSGNYQLSANTPFGNASFNNFQFNTGGGSSTPNGYCSAANASQLRLTISSASTPSVQVFDIFGNASGPAVSSVTLVVKLSTGVISGVVQGTLTFPGVVNLSASPVVLTLYPRCNNGQQCNGQGGFRTFSAVSTGPVINYSIPVSSGTGYYMNVASDYWGATSAGGGQSQPDLTNSTTATVNLQFGAAGRIVGFLRKPDGSVFIPQTGQSVYLQASGGNSWGQSAVGADGSFVIGGLLPGTFTFRVYIQNNGTSASGSGAFPYTIKSPAPQVQVSANQDTLADALLDNAVTILPYISVSSLPALSIFNACPQNNGGGSCPPETWEVYALPVGTPFAPAVVTPMLTGDGSGGSPGSGALAGIFDFSPSTGQVNGCNGQVLTTPGFCSTSIAANAASGSAFDFYLARKGNFDSQNYANGARPYFVIEGSTKSLVVRQSLATSPVFDPQRNSTTTAQPIVINPPVNLSALQQAVVAGTITASNVINQLQFTQLGGSFDGFLKYLPIAWVYDSTGALRAVGLGVPYPPAEKPLEPQLKNSVATGNYTAFKNLISAAGWGQLGYEIRGLTANTSYTLVVTSPNYPPFKSSFRTGVLNSTTTVAVNLDANQGSSLFGVVQTTASAPILAAQVTVKAQGYGPVTLTTDSGGNWRLDGLPAASYDVQIVAAGYAPAAQDVDVAANSTISAGAVSLTASNATITGTVYTNNAICPAGSTSCAAFGKTAIAGATVLAYDDTANVNNPTASLPLSRAVTSSTGAYVLTGLKAGDIYKVFVNAPGYFVLNQSTLTVAGNRPGFDFALKPKPLDVDVYGHPAAPYFEFQITNFTQFSSGKAWIGGSTFVKATSTDVSNAFFQRPDNQGNAQLVLDYPLASLSTGTFVFHVEAQPNDPRAALVVKEVSFGLKVPRNTCQGVDQILLGDEETTNSQGLPSNQAPLDISGGTGGNSTALSMPAGGVIPIFSTATPSLCMTETDVSAALQALIGITSGAFVSSVYTVTLSSINYTQKGVDLSLGFPAGADLTDMAVFSFDATAGKWSSIPGLQTVDPVKSLISVKGLKSLASVLSVGGRGGTGVASAGAAAASPMMAVSDGRTYRPNGIILRPDDTGIFAIVKPSQVSGGAYSGTTVRVFNFPNPFNLQTKSVTLNTSAGVCANLTSPVITDGTIIKYEIPSGISGTGVIRIYTLAGRLVREVDAGNISSNMCYYTVWDGKNKNGQPVANGVYYGVLSVAGKKQGSGVFKMAVIK